MPRSVIHQTLTTELSEAGLKLEKSDSKLCTHSASVVVEVAIDLFCLCLPSCLRH